MGPQLPSRPTWYPSLFSTSHGLWKPRSSKAIHFQFLYVRARMDRDRSPPGSVSSQLCNKGIMRASRVSLHGRKRGWRQQLAADVLDELAILLRLGDHCGPLGIGEKSAPALLPRGHAVAGEHVGDLLAALADQRGPKPGLADAVLLPDPQRLVLEPRQQRRLAPGHAAVDPQFVDHGPSPRTVWTDSSGSLSALIGAASDQRRFDGDVPVRCSRIGTHLVGRLDKALRRRALHPRQAHVEASRQAEGAPFGTEIDLGVDRVIGRQRDLHVARGELHRRLEARGPAGREELLRVGAGARAAGARQPDLEAAVGTARHAGTPACAMGLRGVQHFLESVHNVLLHEEPRRLVALRSSVAIGELAWLGTEMLCGGPK